MAGYGYTYRSFSTYNTARDEARGPVTKPFFPFVPNTNNNSEGYVTKKTIVPVSGPSDEDYDYNKHSSPPKAYSSGGTSPVHSSPRTVDEFLTKVQNEASRPARFSPGTSTDQRQSPQPTAYNGANGYGDYGSNKEGRKPIGGTIRNDNNYDGCNGTNNGYGDYCNYGNKEGCKPIEGTIRNDTYDGYNGTNGYGDYGNYGNKEGRKPIGSTIRNDNKYDGYNGPNGYGDYGNKERHNPSGSPIRNDNYDGYNGANNGYGGYGNYNNKEGRRPFGNTPRNDNYDGYNGGNGYGDYGNYSNKERHKPSGSPILSDNYDRHRPAENYSAKEPNKIIPGGWTRPKISSDWTASPRKGTQLSEPTSDIGKAIELLKDAAKLTSNGHTEDVSGYDNYQRRHDGVDRSTPSIGWAAPTGNGSQHGKPTSKFDKGMELVKEAERIKNIVTGPPRSRSSVQIEPATSNKDDYGETIDRRDGTRRYGNFNFASRPRTAPTHDTFIDGREGDYRDDTRRYVNTSLSGPVIDSREAEKKYKGRRI